MQLLFDYGHNFYHWGLYKDIKVKFQTAHKMISERLTYPHQNLKGPKNQGIYSMPPFLKKHIFDHIFREGDNLNIYMYILMVKESGNIIYLPFQGHALLKSCFETDECYCWAKYNQIWTNKYLKSGPWNILSNLHACAHKHVMHCDVLAN